MYLFLLNIYIVIIIFFPDQHAGTWHVDECWLAIMLHFTFYIVIVLTSEPENIRATGLHQPIAADGCHSPLIVQEQFGLIGNPNSSYDITRTKYWDPAINLTTKVELRYGPYELFNQPVIITRNHTICPFNFSEHVQEFWCTKEYKCRAQHRGYEMTRTQNEIDLDRCTLPMQGTEFYTICGTPYIDPITGRDTSYEYIMVICGVCFVAMTLFTSIYHYPLTLLDVLLSGFRIVPMYYKVKGQNNKYIVNKIIQKKVNTTTGKALYLVSHINRNDATNINDFMVLGGGGGGDNNSEWVEKKNLVSDGMGPVYGERGGLYGYHGVHHETSTRERLRTFDSYCHAMERLNVPLQMETVTREYTKRVHNVDDSHGSKKGRKTKKARASSRRRTTR